jgi:predicted HicB family RNase H-like nuclease
MWRIRLDTPAKLKNPASKHSGFNFSLDERVKDLLDSEAEQNKMSVSGLLNRILKNRYGIIN